MASKLLVPLDGSPLSEKALPYAVAWAKRTGAALELLRTTKGDPGPVQSYLDEVASRLAPEGLQIQTAAREGTAWRLILEHSQEAEAVVMSAVGRGGGLQEWFLGSVTSRVVRAAPCPVLVLAGRALAEEELQKFQTVLVPLDGSKMGGQALPVAEQVVEPEGEVILYRALITSETEHGLPHAGAAAAAEREAAESYLDQMVEKAEHKWVRTHYSQGTPTRGVIEAARQLGVDLVVMTTHGLSGFVRFICGSVTESVLHAGVCPVLVVNPSYAERNAENAS